MKLLPREDARTRVAPGGRLLSWLPMPETKTSTASDGSPSRVPFNYPGATGHRVSWRCRNRFANCLHRQDVNIHLQGMFSWTSARRRCPVGERFNRAEGLQTRMFWPSRKIPTAATAEPVKFTRPVGVRSQQRPAFLLDRQERSDLQLL